jgi:hypothetical protein
VKKQNPISGALRSPYRRGRKYLKLFGSHLHREGFTQLLENVLVYQTFLVSPADIRYVTERKFPDHPVSKVAGDDWDGLTRPVEELESYQSLKSVVHEKQSWPETQFYKRISNGLHQGKKQRGYRTEEELQKKLEYVQNQYREMQEIGYLASHSDAEISVAVGRHGDLLLNEGEMSLICARLSGVDQIPVTIAARHREWMRFKGKILKFMLKNKNRVYAPLTHPDLKSIPARWGNKRFELIRRNLITRNGSLLDIGCHWGYFCHRFEEIGFRCTGVEVDPENIFFLEKLKRASNRKFTVVTTSIFDYLPSQQLDYDVVLALAIFHHFVKNKESLEQLKALLKRLKMRELYFLPHDPAEIQMEGAYWNPPENEFIQFLLENTTLTKIRKIGDVGYGRTLYQLT